MLIHYYFGNLKEAFLVAVGTAIRAKGHNFNVESVIIKMNSIPEFQALDQIICHYCCTYAELIDQVNRWLKLKTVKKKANLCLIFNFDALYRQLTSKERGELMEKIRQLSQIAEIILVGKEKIEEIITQCDYVSEIIREDNPSDNH